ncbi:PP2C family serine/threonine-protein phosphatase [Streptomyces sp. NPDC051940]|uniref:PP2C family serine/threonine-protein phosphatase n=1 Tax=Streptomyces sp. NPDC051940 TaxID=3155675 RepID=UPI00344AE9EB
MAPEAGQLTECPNCGEPLESDFLFCEECGTNLSAPAASPNGGPTPPDDEAPATDSFRIAPASAVPEPDSDGFHLAAPETDPEHYRIAEPLTAAARDGWADPRAALGAPVPPTGSEAETVAEVKTCVACRTGTIDADGYCENCGHAQPRERDRMEREVEGVAAVSDRGLRHHRNEDAFAIDTTRLPNGTLAVIAVVCDGVSSATRPDEASAAASVAARAALMDDLAQGTHPQQAMHDALLAAARSVAALAGDPSNRVGHTNAPACTCVSAIIAGGILTVGWVGDSRAYWVPDDRTAPAARLTEDDSWAAQMVAAGLMSEADAYADQRAHAITGWLGADAHELDPHTASFKPEGPGVVVVCTDGLWNYAEAAEEMAAVVPADARARPLHSAQALVGHALDGGGHDNVTVAVLPFPAG